MSFSFPTSVTRRSPPIKVSNTKSERNRLRNALKKAKDELAKDEASLRQSLGKEEAEIFLAQALVLDDPVLLDAAEHAIEEDHENAALAWQKSCQRVASAYRSLQDEYMRQRAADIQDIGNRVVEALGISRREIPVLPRPGILVIEDLTPADVTSLSSESVLGVICLQGGKTSHAAILLRAQGLPAIAHAEEFLERAGVERSDGKTIAAFDGESGELWLDPATDKLRELRKRKEELANEAERVARLRRDPAITKDGQTVAVLANLGDATEAADALERGAEGVGLFRTEFLFLNRDDAPGEDEQFGVLKELRFTMDRRPVTIRTLDIGGDKNAPGLSLPKEANPVLGVRAIRLCLNRRELFRTHLRAILRAAHGADFRIHRPELDRENIAALELDLDLGAGRNLHYQRITFHRHSALPKLTLAKLPASGANGRGLAGLANSLASLSKLVFAALSASPPGVGLFIISGAITASISYCNLASRI